MQRSLFALALLAAVVARSTVRAAEDEPAVMSFKADPAHTSIVFRVKHMGVAWVHGRFNDFEGAGAFARSGAGASIGFTVKAASVDTNNEKRDTHLRSADFLDVEKFPTIEFASAAFDRVGETDEYDVVGKLTLHGVTREITARVVFNGETKNPDSGEVRIGFDARFVVDRSAFGIDYGIPGIGNEIETNVAAECVVSD